MVSRIPILKDAVRIFFNILNISSLGVSQRFKIRSYVPFFSQTATTNYHSSSLPSLCKAQTWHIISRSSGNSHAMGYSWFHLAFPIFSQLKEAWTSSLEKIIVWVWHGSNKNLQFIYERKKTAVRLTLMTNNNQIQQGAVGW